MKATSSSTEILELPIYTNPTPSPTHTSSAFKPTSTQANLAEVHQKSIRAPEPEANEAERLAARETYRSLTGTRKRNIDGNRSDFGTENINSTVLSQNKTKTEKLSDSDSDSEVGAPDSSDDDSSDDEFGSVDNPKMSPKDRNELEAVISGNKIFSTVQFKKEWDAAKAEDDAYVRQHRIDKYGWDVIAGAANQLVSFGVAGATATLTGNIWLFPVVAMLTCDLIGDRLAQVIRRSTIVADSSKTHFENQRRLARLLGELVESCYDHKPKKKYTVSITDPRTGDVTKVKMTGQEALKHTGCSSGMTAWGQNLLIRGLPFVWFSAIYGPRDYYLNYRCEDFFFPNATATHQPNFTLPSGCPSPEHIDPVALRWSVVLLGGMMAGAMTTLTNQLFASLFPHEERTNYSRETFRKEVIYKESAKLDAKVYLDWLGQQENPNADEIKSTQTLMRLYDKELRVARKKSSYWTTFQGEVDLSTQKHRDETMISPEFGSKQLELFMNALGRGISLIAFCLVASRFNVRASTEEQDKIMGLILIPMSLIVIGGYMWKDDARMCGLGPYGAVKGAWRACKGKSRHPGDSDNDDHDDTMTTTEVPKIIVDTDAESVSRTPSKVSPNKSPGKSEKIASTSDTFTRSTKNDSDKIMFEEESDEGEEDDESVIV